MSTENDISDLIDKLATEKTFSLDGVKAIETLRVRARELEREADRQTQRADKNQSDFQETQTKLRNAEEALRAFQKREAELLAREHKQLKLECDVEMHKALAAQANNLFGIVFKNVTVRQNIFGSQPVVVPYGGGNAGVQQVPFSQNTETEQG